MFGGESIGEVFDDGVVPASGECGHVEHGSDITSSSSDGSMSVVFSAVIVEGRESAERSDLSAVELSEFGDIGDEGDFGDIADAGYGFEDLCFWFPFVRGFDEREDLFFECVDGAVELPDGESDIFEDNWRERLLSPIFFGGSELDELSSSCRELLEFVLQMIDFGDHSGLGDFAESGDDMRINSISFGEDSESFCEVSDLPWVDDGDEVSGLDEFSDESSFEVSGGFDGDEAGAGFGEFFEE